MNNFLDAVKEFNNILKFEGALKKFQSKFNPNHVESGPNGGQFTSSGYKINIIRDDYNLTKEEQDEYLAATGIPKDLEGDARIIKYRNKLTLDIKGEKLEMIRIFDTKEKIIQNDWFRIDNDSRFKGHGAEIFNNQVEAASKQGYKKITAWAARSGNSTNGYYTWARLGYIPNDDNLVKKAVSGFNLKNKTDVKDFKELMGIKSGQEYWRENGDEFVGEFDLESGSYSRNTLKNYIDAKRKK